MGTRKQEKEACVPKTIASPQVGVIDPRQVNPRGQSQGRPARDQQIQADDYNKVTNYPQRSSHHSNTEPQITKETK